MSQTAPLPKAITPSLEENLLYLHQMLQGCDDFVFRPFRTAADIPGMLVYSILSTDQNFLSQTVLPALYRLEMRPERGFFPEAIRDRLPFLPEKTFTGWPDALVALSGGSTLILLDGVAETFPAATAQVEHRGIERSETEPVIRGPQEAFTEALSPNLAIIRARMKNPDLKINLLKLGEKSHTDVALAYLEGEIQPALLAEIRKRLSGIKLPSVQESGFLTEFLARNSYTPFPLVQSTERPDKVIAAMLEGRGAVLVEGSPFALLLPTTFWHFFQSPDDYFQSFFVGTIIRWIRYLAYILAAALPALYLAFTVFQPDMLPLRFLFSLSAARENVPVPTVVEILIMLIALDIFREAALRLPRSIGPAIGIVGALVLGEAAVSAGIISPIMVIVLALTAISTFAIPTEDLRSTVRIFSYALVLFSSVLGLYGFLLGASAILLHACSLDSLGVPYFAPVATLHWREWQDVFVRAPWPVIGSKQQKIKAQRRGRH
ncbi:Bacillus/Clostridium Ger spore germination protein [Acididesulfobacillus acetoxydans]|uniref:Bacillus/Clostridium Ger spore germination protein n=1 Tax=Acididesulfobacillus acetoxydans TaxID=1561005 RepID=A0A8S0XVM6_9FIRM|nr:spore germination protein [Acididesulfobacillus acetoxydans]CAA7600467.1 Bacillus/Clostridium Ger spore germination protein [Acididesulfobacillus acetoxydans]CEJ06601.1 Spore germination protein KA [Acididesulfobacillus acetoxydans]